MLWWVMTKIMMKYNNNEFVCNFIMGHYAAYKHII